MKNDLQYANSLEILHKFDWGKKYLIEMTIVNWYTWHWWTSEDQSICCLQPWSNPKLSGQGNRSGFVHSDIWWFNFYLNVFWYHKKLNLYIYVCTFMWSVYYYRFYQPCFTTLFQKGDKCSISQENQKSQKRWYTALLWWNWAKNVIEYFICEQKYLKLYSLLQNITVITLSCWISIL